MNSPADVAIGGDQAACLQLFRTAERALAVAGTSLKEVVMTRIYCPSPEDFDKITPIPGEKFRGITPASVGIAADLARSEIRVEIKREAII